MRRDALAALWSFGGRPRSSPVFWILAGRTGGELLGGELP
ncbi:hypothetical protein SCE1572_07130 [Sorangium cellulosum So0157-2]|uniref:Uncharacterized protein n=1 Tax=Sorangium cellulosum So0157-2 TaxID=1254432 RepID=S4XP46_SORCE|nr:hypothetical protein SCE1572_07130 [Sorangium cellulosum So0157-2]